MASNPQNDYVLQQLLILLMGIPFAIAGIVCLLNQKNSTTVSEKVAPQPTESYQSYESDVFKRGKRQLEMQGYKNVTPYAYPSFCCSKKESFWSSEGFKATDKDNATVIGCICIGKGLRNSITIRFE